MSFALSILFACLAFAGPAIIEPVKFDEKKLKEFQKKSCAAVNSAHYVQKDARFMIVAPISTSPSGALRYGLQRTFVSDHCLDAAGVRRR